MIKSTILFLFAFFCFYSNASTIVLHTKNATIWLPQQTIKGKVFSLSSNKIKWHVNDSSGFTNIQQNGIFSFSFTLYTTNNIIWVEDVNHTTKSDTIHYILGYTPLPEVKPFATISNNTATLNVNIINNPYNLPLSYSWVCSKSPAPVSIKNKASRKATAEIPATNGDYFFTVIVNAGTDTAKFITYITRTDAGLHAFNITTDYASWIDSAIIYEITPYVFVKNGQYPDITNKLPELKELGVNTIWLQPVYKSQDNEQGYDVTDYFSLRTDLGTEKQLHDLIATAKKLNMHVLFDFVPNHTSIYHPYAKEVKQFGDTSHYYNLYQHTDDGAKYSSLYQYDDDGFVHYFWDELVNIDYSNAEAQRWIIEAYKYWLQNYDIDGYRIDAAWALNARNENFGTQLQQILKSIKPGILLLAEDKGALKKVYTQGYDAAYDWRADSGWISKWSWATDYDPPLNPTIFNYYDENKRSSLLDNSLFKNGDTTHLRLRFMENNDQQRFITAHGKERTKMASALLFSLPGLPLIYNGQEIGYERKVNGNRAIFKADESIQSLDTNNLFEWYKKLNTLRLQHDAMRSNHMQSLAITDESLYALYRYSNNENIIVVINPTGNLLNAEINIKSLKKATGNAIKYTDLLTNEIFYADENANSLKLPVKKFTAKILLASNNDTTSIAIEQ